MVATVSPPSVEFERDRLRVVFDRFDLAAYELFLRCKALPESLVEFDRERESYTLSAPARFAPMLGVPRPTVRDEHPLAEYLREDQRILTGQALDAKRFAMWCLCGYGKTPCGLEFARQASLRTGGRSLIITTNDLVRQWLDEAKKFYGDALPLVRLKSRAEMKEWCEHGTVQGVPTAAKIAITNYEKFNPDESGQVVNECRHLACVVLDEASRLKSGGGKQKWALIKSFKGVEYKLTLTATPAPNELMEFASQAAFLEKMRTESDIIWTFFTRDPKSHRWTVKPHARAAFFEFMSTWSVYVNDPKAYGWRLDEPDVPRPVYHTIEVPATAEQLELAAAAAADPVTGQGTLFVGDDTNAIQRMKLGQLAKGFRYIKGAKGLNVSTRAERVASHKPGVVADIVRREAAAGAQVLVWTVFEEESLVLGELLHDLAGLEVLTGKVKLKGRAAMIDRFKSGETSVLVTRARMLGYGQNLQFVGAMVFSGWTDSFEDFYQAVRRAFRFGQTEALRVYLPVVAELEGDTFANVRRKEAEFERSIAEMEANYLRARARLYGETEVAA